MHSTLAPDYVGAEVHLCAQCASLSVCFVCMPIIGVSEVHNAKKLRGSGAAPQCRYFCARHASKSFCMPCMPFVCLAWARLKCTMPTDVGDRAEVLLSVCMYFFCGGLLCAVWGLWCWGATPNPSICWASNSFTHPNRRYPKTLMLAYRMQRYVR